MRRARFAWLMALLAATSLTGSQACQSAARCLRHTDCTRQEFCDLGTCVMKPSQGSGLGDAGAGAEQATGGWLSASGGRTATGGRASSGGDAGNAGAAGSAGDAGSGN